MSMHSLIDVTAIWCKHHTACEDMNVGSGPFFTDVSRLWWPYYHPLWEIPLFEWIDLCNFIISFFLFDFFSCWCYDIWGWQRVHCMTFDKKMTFYVLGVVKDLPLSRISLFLREFRKKIALGRDGCFYSHIVLTYSFLSETLNPVLASKYTISLNISLPTVTSLTNKYIYQLKNLFTGRGCKEK